MNVDNKSNKLHIEDVYCSGLFHPPQGAAL